MAALGDDFFVQTFTTTLQKYEKKLVDQVLLDHPVLELFKANAKSYTGRGLVIPVRAADLSATGYSDDSGTHSTAVSADILGSAVYEWPNTIITPFRLKHNHILENKGPEQIVNLVEEYVKAATADHGNFITSELHKTASSWSTGKVLSLDVLIGDIATDTTAGITVGGISHNRRSTTTRERAAGVATVGVANANTYFAVGDIVTVWDMPAAYNVTRVKLTAVTSTTISYPISVTTTESQAAETGGKVAKKDYWQATRVTSSAGTDDIAAAFRRVVNDIYESSRKRPTHVIVGRSIYEELEAYLVEKGQYQLLNGGTAQLRFSAIKFGDLEVRLDSDCQDDRAYFLNKDSLRFGYCAGEFMKAYPAQPLQGTLDTVVPLASRIVFGVAERRANGLLIRTA
jgi:hypothetical protein